MHEMSNDEIFHVSSEETSFRTQADLTHSSSAAIAPVSDEKFKENAHQPDFLPKENQGQKSYPLDTNLEPPKSKLAPFSRQSDFPAPSTPKYGTVEATAPAQRIGNVGGNAKIADTTAVFCGDMDSSHRQQQESMILDTPAQRLQADLQAVAAPPLSSDIPKSSEYAQRTWGEFKSSSTVNIATSIGQGVQGGFDEVESAVYHSIVSEEDSTAPSGKQMVSGAKKAAFAGANAVWKGTRGTYRITRYGFKLQKDVLSGTMSASRALKSFGGRMGKNAMGAFHDSKDFAKEILYDAVSDINSTDIGAQAVTKPFTTLQETKRTLGMAQKVGRGTKKVAKGAMSVVKKAVKTATWVLRGSVKVLSFIAAPSGGLFLVLILSFFAIAALIASPFGFLFSDGSTDTISISQAIGQINSEFGQTLAEYQDNSSGFYDGVYVSGNRADWAEVVAVFACRYTLDSDSAVDIATIDADRLDKLRTVFNDMTTVTVRNTRTVHNRGQEDEWVERNRYITISGKTAAEMESAYHFNEEQKASLKELLESPELLEDAMQSLTISGSAMEVQQALPADLSPDRKIVAETALQLVGKVNYFWGGKYQTEGWNPAWGELNTVTAGGSVSSGTIRPYGLDCSGFVFWTLYNAGLVEHGSAAQWHIGQNLTQVRKDRAQIGDFALPNDESHIGIIVGKAEDGDWLVCHCSSVENNVVITEFTGHFDKVGRPAIYN